MKLDEVSDADIHGALAAVKHGHDPVAAKNLIEYFYERIHEGKGFNERVLLAFLDHAFGRIVNEGWDPNHAFGFKLKRGKHTREDTTERNIVAAAYVVLLMRRNWLWKDAKGEAANLLFPDGRGDKAVEKAYGQYRALECLPDEYLAGLLPEGTPVISRDITG